MIERVILDKNKIRTYKASLVVEEVALTPIERRFELEGRLGCFGVRCTAEGVSLAGVPLLRKTVAGLTPRPMEELAVLMKSAYGRDIHSIRPYPGLDVIAQALNRGDVGRAMVAAIQLRLPDLNEEGAARIARVDEALHKYDPSEPRDERGRWTIGGASSRNASAKPSTSHSVKPATRTRPVKPTKPAKPARRPVGFGDSGMRPILVSDSDGPSGLPPGPGGITSIGSKILNIQLSKECVSHAHEPRYYEKTQACAAVFKQCGWLIDVNAENVLRRDACLWPDGAAAIMKLGVLVPFKTGHRF